MHGMLLTVYDYSVAGIGSTVVSDDQVMLSGQKVNNLPLAFISPLHADNGGMLG